LIGRSESGNNPSSMITLLLSLFRVVFFLFGGHRQLALENFALRQQLAVYQANGTPAEAVHACSGVALARVWAGWRQALIVVSPDTVLRWQRRRFRGYCTQLSARATGGRPPVSAEVAALIRKTVAANPLWGAPRIHGELLKLGVSRGVTIGI
jgi:hypothetical protein